MYSLLFGIILFTTLVVGMIYTTPIYEKAIESDLEQKVRVIAQKQLKSEAKVEQLKIQCEANSLTLDTSMLTDRNRDTLKNELSGILGISLPSSLYSTHSSRLTDEIGHESVISFSKIEGHTDEPVSNKKPVARPHFSVIENDRKNTLTLEGALASTNEKLEILSYFKGIKQEQFESRHLIDKLEVHNDLTTIQDIKQLCLLGYQFVITTENAQLHWDTKRITLSGEMKTEPEILAMIQKFESIYPNDEGVLRSGLVLAKEPTLDFTVERLSNNKIIISGILPEKEMGDRLYEIVKLAHHSTLKPQEKAYIVNNLRYSELQKEAWWLGAPELFVPNFLKQTEGIAKIEYSQDCLYIEGIYKNQEEFIEARSSFQKIPKEMKVYDDFLRFRE